MPSFIHPVWLAVGLLSCCAAILFITFSTVRRRKKLAHFAAPHLLPVLTANVSQTRRRLKATLFVLGLACLFLALAQPQWGNHLIELRQKGIDILIGFDVSKSMLAQDVKPNRLERAKLAVRDFAAKLDGDRIGLLPFAGTSFLICPLTADYDAFNASLNALDVNTIPKGGTNIGAAIHEATKVLAGEQNHKILILLTDGENLTEQHDTLKAAELAKQEKMIIYTVGVGTPQGELIPLPGGGAGNFVKDERGEFVTSKLDEKTLTAIAETTGGLYASLGSMGQGFDTIYERKLALIPKEEQAQRKKKVPIDRFQWPLAAALVFFSLEFLLIGRRRAVHLPFIFTAGRRKKQQETAAAVMLVCLCLAAPARADKGSDLFHAGKYKEAEAFYQGRVLEDSGNAALHFNLGTALHKQGVYGRAAEEFKQALQTDDLVLQAKSYYNRGVSQYETGRTLEAADLNQAITQLQQAKQSLEAALNLKPENAKAAQHLQTVEKKLAELQKKQGEEQRKKEEEGKQQQKNDSQKKQGQVGKKEEPGSQKNNDQQGQNKEEQSEKAQQAQEKDGEKKQQSQQNGKPDSVDNQQDKKGSSNAEKKAEQQVNSEKPPLKGQEEAPKMMGKMTEEEARNLLDSLKNEQGELNFIPQEVADERSDW
jgi:Ca-activated chloride channel homolog